MENKTEKLVKKYRGKDFIKYITPENKDMKELVIDEGFKTLYTDSFSSCKNLERVFLPSTIETFIDAFSDCPLLKEIIVSEDNPYYKSVDGIVYSKDGESLIKVPTLSKQRIEIKEGVKSLEERCFTHCNALTVKLPATLEVIHDYAFNSSYFASLTIPRSVTQIYRQAFFAMPFLQRITIEEGNEVYTSIDGIMYRKNMKTLCFIPPKRRGKVVIEDRVETIYTNAFANCDFSSITLPSSLQQFTPIGRNGQKEVFVNCKNLEEIIFNNKKQKVLDDWFKPFASYVPYSYNNNDISFYIKNIYPSQLTKKQKYRCSVAVFNNLLNDEDKEWDRQWRKYIARNIESYINDIKKSKALLIYLIKYKMIPLNLIRELLDFFNEEERIDETSLLLDYQNSNFSIDEIMKNKEEEFNVDVTSSSYIKKRFRYKLKDDGSYKITSYIGREKEIIVPSLIDGKAVTEIGDNAFNPWKEGRDSVIKENLEKIESITLPDTVTEIGKYCFSYLPHLHTLKLSDNIKVLNKKGGRFIHETPSLKSLTLPKYLEVIGEDCFRGCDALTNITLFEGVTTIESSAFSSCLSLTSINIPSSVKVIEDYAFFNCRSLTHLELGEGVKTLGENAFLYCSDNFTLTFNEKIENIASKLFLNDGNVTVRVKKGSEAHFWTFLRDYNVETY